MIPRQLQAKVCPLNRFRVMTSVDVTGTQLKPAHFGHNAKRLAVMAAFKIFSVPSPVSAAMAATDMVSTLSRHYAFWRAAGRRGFSSVLHVGACCELRLLVEAALRFCYPETPCDQCPIVSVILRVHTCRLSKAWTRSKALSAPLSPCPPCSRNPRCKRCKVLL